MNEDLHFESMFGGRFFCIASAVLLGMAAATVAAGQAVPLVATVDLALLASPKTQGASKKLLLDVASVGSRLIVVGDAGRILVSNDHGHDWKQADSPTSVMLTTVVFANEREGWTAGHDGVILATHDGGIHWIRQFDGTQANLQMLVAAQAQAQRATQMKGATEQVVRQREVAESKLIDAEAAVKGGPSIPFFGLCFLDAKMGFAVGALGQFFQTVDAGVTWKYIGDRLDNPLGLHLNSIVAGSDGNLYIAAEMGRVFRSTDAGRSWTTHDLGYGGQLYGIVPLASQGRNHPLVAYGFNGHLFRSNDGGVTWTSIPSPVSKTIVRGVALDATSVLLVTQDGQLLISRDAGVSFTRRPESIGLYSVSSFVMSNPQGVVSVGVGGVALLGLSAGVKQ